jgi:hypothetical protein
LLGKFYIPRSDEAFDRISPDFIELNAIRGYRTCSIHRCEDKSLKTAFKKVKGCKAKDHPDGNAASGIIEERSGFVALDH